MKSINALPNSKSLALVKGSHQFELTYVPGDELSVLDELVRMVHQEDLPFDWFDAAVMSHQLGQHMVKELNKWRPENKKGC